MDTDDYRLVIMPIAADDLDSIFDYISKTLDSPGAAHRLMNDIEKALTRLEQYPKSAPKCLDDTLNRKGYRKLVVHNYIALYRIDDKKRRVTVMRVIYGRRKYEQLI